MKKYISFLIIFIFVLSHAQREVNLNLQGFEERRFNWGYYIGVSNWDFKLDPVTDLGTTENITTIESKGSTGLTVGLMGMMNITDNLDVRVEPALHFVSRTLTFTNETIPTNDAERVVKSTYLELPVLLHLRGNRWNNTRPFIAGGVGYMRNLQSNENSTEDNSDDVFRMKTNNYNWQAEAGMEFYFRHFKFTPSVKGIFMINNEIVPDNPGASPYFANAIESLKSRVFMVSLKFE